MASDGECSIRQDWCDHVDDEENLSHTNQDRVGQKNENFRDNGAHYGQAKEQLEEELTRLALVISEKRLLLREMQTCCQEADDELRLALTLLRADLQQKHNDSMLRNVINWEVMEQRIIMTLTEVGECQKKLRLIKFTNLTLLFNVLTQTPRGQETKRSPKICYYCLEEGHFIKECPHKRNSEMWKQTQAFKRKIAFRHRQKIDEMHGATSVSWTGKEGSDEDIIATGQNSKENAIVSYNPLN